MNRLLAFLTLALPVFATTPPPQGDFHLQLAVFEKDVRRNHEAAASFDLRPGPGGRANGNYNGWSDPKSLQITLRCQPDEAVRDVVELTFTLKPWLGVQQHFITTYKDTADSKAVTDCRLQIDTGGGTYLDPQRSGLRVFQYATNVYFSDSRHGSPPKITAPDDIGGWVRITRIDGNFVSGELSVTLYGRYQRPPWLNDGSNHRATVKGKFTAYIYGLEKR